MTTTGRKPGPWLAILTLLGTLAGCAESQLPEATGKGSIDALNAMPASPPVDFFIEQRLLGSLGFKGSLGGQRFDDLSYTFRFQFRFPGDTEPTEIASQFIDVAADTAYTIVLTGSVTAPAVALWERPERQWEGTEMLFELGFAHLAAGLGDIDIYAAPAGTPPVLGEERAKVSFGDQLPAIDLANGMYEIVITARDDPATILYRSFDTLFSARLSYLLAVFDADPSITGNVSVRLIANTGLSTELPDVNFPPTMRIVHAAFGTENIDIYDDEAISNLIFSDLGFGGSTGDLSVADGTATYTYTAVGNPGAIIDQESQVVPRGQRITTVLAGEVGSDLSRIALLDSRRPFETHARIRFIHAAANVDTMDAYLVDAGSDITDLTPTLAGSVFGLTTAFITQEAGSYDLILTLPNEKTPIAGPLPLDLVEGDIVEALFLDTVDPTVPDILITVF